MKALANILLDIKEDIVDADEASALGVSGHLEEACALLICIGQDDGELLRALTRKTRSTERVFTAVN
jgi:hypothetical protein